MRPEPRVEELRGAETEGRGMGMVVGATNGRDERDVMPSVTSLTPDGAEVQQCQVDMQTDPQAILGN